MENNDNFQHHGTQTNNLGYHAGNLGKSEDYYRQSGGRGTGHFGTGTYFVGNPKEIGPGSGYDDRPKHSVDFTPYNNLFKPKDEEQAFNLHKYLKNINENTRYLTNQKLVNAINAYDELNKYKNNDFFNNTIDSNKIKNGKNVAHLINQYNTLGEYLNGENKDKRDYKPYKIKKISDYDEYIKKSRPEILGMDIEDILNDADNPRHFSKMGRYSEDLQNMEALIDNLKEIFPDKDVEKALLNTLGYENELQKQGGWNSSYKKDWDSLSTAFMKALGYGGVDVRHLPKLDNTAYGSVIYDLSKKDAPLGQYNGNIYKRPTFDDNYYNSDENAKSISEADKWFEKDDDKKEQRRRTYDFLNDKELDDLSELFDELDLK